MDASISSNKNISRYSSTFWTVKHPAYWITGGNRLTASHGDFHVNFGHTYPKPTKVQEMNLVRLYKFTA